jgi:hypothetical protein
VPNGTAAAYFGNGTSAMACSTLPGDTSCLTGSTCTLSVPPAGLPATTSAFGGTTGISLQQTVTGLTVGNNYVLEFWAGGENPYNTVIYGGIYAVNIGFGNTFFRCYPTYTNAVGTRVVIQFKATAVSHTVKFTNWGHLGTGSATELVIDDVRLYQQSQLASTVSKCGSTTGLSKEKWNKGEIKPNPFSECMIYELEENSGSSALYVFNYAGKEVRRVDTFGESSVKICRDQLPSGVYFLVKKEGDSFSPLQKFIISDQ